MFECISLKGLTVIFSRMKEFASSGLGIFVRAGARFEPAAVKGAAHFTEHMLFKGTKKFSYKRIKQDIEGRGGSLNGYTSQETAGYYAQFLKKNLDITLDILSDMVLHPLFDKKEIEKERNVILEELKMYNDLPHFRALSLLEQLLWKKHVLGEDIIGREKTIKKIVRRDLFLFQKKFYIPANLCVCCVGDVSGERLLKLLSKKIKSPSGRTVLPWGEAPSSSVKQAVSVEHKPLDQTHFCIGFRGVSYKSEQRFVQELLHVIMGANMSSRLFEEIREKRGLCYEISTETRKFADSGAFIVHCGLDKKNIEPAFRAVLRELKKVTNRPIGRRELARAKDYMLGQLSMTLERPGGRMFYLADSFLAREKIDSFSCLEDKVRSVEPGSIQNLARRMLNFRRLCVSCVGNVGPDMKKCLQDIIKTESE